MSEQEEEWIRKIRIIDSVLNEKIKYSRKFDIDQLIKK